MDPEQHALQTLLAMDEYIGTRDAFIAESTTRIRATLNCDEEEAQRILDRLQGARQITAALAQPGRQIGVKRKSASIRLALAHTQKFLAPISADYPRNGAGPSDAG